MVEPNLKEAVKAMCKAYRWARSNGWRTGNDRDAVQQQPLREKRLSIFEVSELEAMEDISNTSLLADYFARRRGALLVDVPHGRAGSRGLV